MSVCMYEKSAKTKQKNVMSIRGKWSYLLLPTHIHTYTRKIGNTTIASFTYSHRPCEKDLKFLFSTT